jgi:hypothetical protein
MLAHQGDMRIHIGVGKGSPAAVADIPLIDTDAVAAAPRDRAHAGFAALEYALIFVLFAVHTNGIRGKGGGGPLKQRLYQMQELLRHHRTAAKICVHFHYGIQRPYAGVGPERPVIGIDLRLVAGFFTVDNLIVDGRRYKIGTSLDIAIAGARAQSYEITGPRSQVLDPFNIFIPVNASFYKSNIEPWCGLGDGFAELHQVNKIEYIEENLLAIKNGQLTSLATGEIENCHLGFH